MTQVTYTCAQCGRERTVSKSYFNQLYPKGSDKSFACSRKCGCLLRERGHSVWVVCPNCGKENRRSLHKKNRLFCDVSCYGEYRRNHPELYPANRYSEETRQRISKERTGKGNPMYGSTGDRCVHWKGGRDSYRGKGWRTTRKLIKRRDGNRCALCSIPETPDMQMDVHHVFDWTESYCNHPHNLITVCSSCHQGRLHGNGQSLPDRQLVSLARQATRDRLAPDDLQLLEELDRQERDGKPVPPHIAEKLGALDYWPNDWRQARLFSTE